jgi:pimeloyl-ACP methyl ester carboxylesterase
MRKTLTCLFVATMAGCPDVETDVGEGSDFVLAPTVEFDPSAGIIPFPNDLLRDPTTGLVNIPPAPCETPAQTALRVGTLNKLNGFGTFEVEIQVTFTQPVDPNSIPNHILLFQTTPPTLIPTTPFVGTTLRFSAADCAAPATVNSVVVVPQIPLPENTTFVVVVTQGLTTPTGEPFVPSPTFALLAQPTPAVVFDDQGNLIVNRTPLLLGQDANGNGVPDTDELLGLAKLEAGFQPLFMFLGALGISGSDTLIAFAFTTQTTTDPLNPAVPGSVANTLPTTPLVGARSITAGATGQQFLQQVTAGQCGRLPSCCQVDGGPLPCQAVGDVFGAVLVSPDYQQQLPNPLAGAPPLPGPWDNPVHPTLVAEAQLQAIAVIPATPPPASGYPTVIFAHGLTSSKEAVFAIAPQLAAVGIMTVAIDLADHGSRAVLISTDPAIGCSGQPVPTAQPQCFAPILSTDLATTRDTLRQSALDFERLALAVEACGTNACSSIQANPSRLMYLGQSLGGIVGTLVVSTSQQFQSGVLNVTGVGLLDIIENTQTLAITCPVVDALIDEGVLQGAKSDLAANPPTGLCTTNAWQTQPGWLQFRPIAQWVLDPADGANYTRLLAMRRILLQEVIGDLVVPNISTNTLGVLLGLSPMMADPATTIPPPPSRAITTNPNASKWVQYVTLRPAPPFPGNTFAHASLLRPANDQADGLLGTARLQSDAITYLRNNE